MLNSFFTKCMANDDFSEPPRRADSKNPIFLFFASWGSVMTVCPCAVLLCPFYDPVRDPMPLPGRPNTRAISQATGSHLRCQWMPRFLVTKRLPGTPGTLSSVAGIEVWQVVLGVSEFRRMIFPQSWNPYYNRLTCSRFHGDSKRGRPVPLWWLICQRVSRAHA